MVENHSPPSPVVRQPAPEVLLRYHQDIEAELRAVLAGYSEPLYTLLAYHFGWVDASGQPARDGSGKGLRPTLCLLACEALGGAIGRALPAAAALELVHNFSLIHDDIQDDDAQRRGRPTVWAIWGKPQAINAGTAMRILANVSMGRLAAQGVTPSRLAHAQSLLDLTTLALIEGQYLDLSFEERFDISEQDYLRMIEKKTASLIACSLEMGAFLATQDRKLARLFREFGRHLGLAFQVRDDILGAWGQAHQLGKPVGSDIRRKKKSYPIVLALSAADPWIRESLVAAYQQPAIDERLCAQILDLLEAVQARQRAQALVDHHHLLALQALAELPVLPWARQELAALVAFLSARET